MKNKPIKIPDNALQQAIMKAAVASAKIEGILISEKDAQKSLEKALSELTKVHKKD